MRSHIKICIRNFDLVYLPLTGNTRLPQRPLIRWQPIHPCLPLIYTTPRVILHESRAKRSNPIKRTLLVKRRTFNRIIGTLQKQLPTGYCCSCLTTSIFVRLRVRTAEFHTIPLKFWQSIDQRVIDTRSNFYRAWSYRDGNIRLRSWKFQFLQ